jgi:hypothetical protein
MPPRRGSALAFFRPCLTFTADSALPFPAAESERMSGPVAGVAHRENLRRLPVVAAACQ